MKKLTPKEIGDKFEKRAYEIIKNCLENETLGILPQHSVLKLKPKYFSHGRGANIEFDMSIEVTLPGFDKTTMTFLIECKSFKNSAISVNKIETFLSQMDQMNFAKKGVFLTTSKLQSGAYELLKNKNVMLFIVDEEKYDILLPKKNKLKTENSWLEDEFIDLIHKAFLPNSLFGLEKLSKNQIKYRVEDILNDFNPDVLRYWEAVNLADLLKYLSNKYGLRVMEVETEIDSNLLGEFDSTNKTISINKSIVNTNRYSFTVAHEIGHFFLHSQLSANKSLYDNFSDTSYNFLIEKYEINNVKNQIEWQANYFASCLLLPGDSLLDRLSRIQIEMGINKFGIIFLDGQKSNYDDFNLILNRLAMYFSVSKTSIRYKLKELNAIVESKKKIEKKEELRKTFYRDYDY